MGFFPSYLVTSPHPTLSSVPSSVLQPLFAGITPQKPPQRDARGEKYQNLPFPYPQENPGAGKGEHRAVCGVFSPRVGITWDLSGCPCGFHFPGNILGLMLSSD